MPNADTFSIKPIGEFVRRYLGETHVSVDPFARNKDWCTWTNDLNPATSANFHMDAAEFCTMLHSRGVKCTLGIFDPPYSPRQISECYKGVGKLVTTQDTQSSFWRKNKDALDLLIPAGGIVLTFGWNSMGMGLNRGYSPIEILMVTHGGAHNDTICMAEIKEAR